ncbi:MAG: hypothetical protein IE921_02425 [Rhodobacteraceae bacterium]|nr:hypothetical protein [Paracoccaceae bacterium]
MFEAVDPRAPGQLFRLDDADGTTLVSGELADLPALAGRLGMAAGLPPAQVARAALERFGVQLPAELIGEWSLLHCDPDGGITLVQSAARRDPILYALSGRKIAVAPTIASLARISWVGTEIDPVGLLGKLGRPSARAQADDRTMVARVRQLLPGETVHIAPDGSIRRQRARLFDVIPQWRGTLADAAAEAEELLLHVLADHTARSPRIAGLLSGGLDSSLLAWAAAQSAGEGSRPIFVTSVSPTRTGIPDESAEARLVADYLGCEWLPVAPPEDANPYRPAESLLHGDVGPSLSNRQEVTLSIQHAAQAAGATALMNGTYGESSFTLLSHPGRFATPSPLRRLARSLRSMLNPPEPLNHSPFHVRLAKHRMDNLDPAFLAPVPQDPLDAVRRDGRLGYLAGARKGMMLANEVQPGALRMLFPYRDMRLLRLFAGFPRSVLAETGGDREPARMILDGRLPDAIRLRRSGLPASPGHMARLKRHAPAAHARIAAFRKAGVDDWLDLDWLDTALMQLAASGTNSVIFANEVQLTSMTAEFLLWWNSGH